VSNAPFFPVQTYKQQTDAIRGQRNKRPLQCTTTSLPGRFGLTGASFSLLSDVTVRIRSERILKKNVIDYMKNAVVRRVDVGFNEPCTVYKQFALYSSIIQTLPIGRISSNTVTFSIPALIACGTILHNQTQTA